MGSVWHNMYVNEKQLPAKNTSRQLTTVRAQKHVKTFNHQTLYFLNTKSQANVHLGCQTQGPESRGEVTEQRY